MPPKFDPNLVVELIVKTVGGETSTASALGPKLGPYGVPPKKVAEEIASKTMDLKGSKVTVKLRIQNRQATVTVVPAASTLLLKALKEPGRDRKKVKNVKHSGNITFDTILDIARQMRDKSMSRSLKGTVKEILGTAMSIGCTVEGLPPREVTKRVNDGVLLVPEA